MDGVTPPAINWGSENQEEPSPKVARTRQPLGEVPGIMNIMNAGQSTGPPDMCFEAAKIRTSSVVSSQQRI